MNQSPIDAATDEGLANAPSDADAPPETAVPSQTPPEAGVLSEADAAAVEIARLREQIDAVDAEIVRTVQQRVALSKQIQAVRMAHGGRRLEHSRELKIVSTYVDGLGRGGGQLALTLLELSRGRA